MLRQILSLHSASVGEAINKGCSVPVVPETQSHKLMARWTHGTYDRFCLAQVIFFKKSELGI